MDFHAQIDRTSKDVPENGIHNIKMRMTANMLSDMSDEETGAAITRELSKYANIGTDKKAANPFPPLLKHVKSIMEQLKLLKNPNVMKKLSRTVS